MAMAERMVPSVAELAERICMIPAPTGCEGERARFVAAELERRGLVAEIDEVNNVYARRPGAGSSKALMLSAHTDTVFPAGTALRVERREGRMTGPGIGDNSLGVAGLLVLLDLLNEAGISTPGDLILVANVGEEGLGNLLGMRVAVDRFEPELGGAIVIEGHDLGRVTHVAVGSKRIRMTVDGPGGHSWGAFGEPNAIHELAAIVTDIARLQVPAEPKTTYNVGLIEGGVSVNTIAPRASAVIDMRSTDPGALAELARDVESIAARRTRDTVTVSIEVLGERPAGSTPAFAPMVRAAVDALATLDISAELNASSTDANVPIARGIPAVCLGLTRGAGAHRLDETIEVAPIRDGLVQLAVLVDRFPVDPSGRRTPGGMQVDGERLSG